MSATLSPAWRRALPGLALVLLGVLVLYRDTALAMVEIWNRSETFAHAFVVPPISLWLIWRQRAVLARLTPQPAPVFVLPVVALAFLWLLGDLVAVNAATQLAFTALLVLVVPATLGWPVTRAIAFPLGFLFFAVPIGEFMMPQLMAWTADFTVMALRASGIPVYREALQFVIPSGNWSVVEACSGIRYLIASVMVGTLFAYLNYRSLKKRWIFIGVSIALPLLGNWVRAYMIVLIGHLSSNQLATGVDHIIYGWVFFGVIMLAMFMIGARWADPPVEGLEAPVAQGDVAPARWRWAVLAGLALAIAAPQLALLALAPMPGAAPRLQAPELSAKGWQSGEAPPAQWKPAFAYPDVEFEGRYRWNGGPTVGLYIGYYGQHDPRGKLISSVNVLVRSNDPEWVQAVHGSSSLELAGRSPVTVRSTELRGATLSSVDDRRLRVWQLYWVDGRLTSRDWQAKLYGALERLTGRGGDGAVVVLHAEKSDAGEADALMRRFMQDNWDAIEAALKRARADRPAAQQKQ